MRKVQSMPQWFERYTGTDAVVSNAPATLRVLEEKLGIPAGQPMRTTGHGVGFDVSYLQMNEDPNLAASAVQLLGLKPLARHEPKDQIGKELRSMLLAYVTSQRFYRPILSHVQCLGTPSQVDVNEIIELLKSRGVPHIAKIDNVYIGLVEDNGRMRYEPSADAGTLLEFAKSLNEGYPGLLRPPNLPESPVAAQVPPGSLIRPIARTQITPSAEEVIERFRFMLDWPEEGDIEHTEGDGYRSIVIKPNNPLSAVWEMVEPTRADGRAGETLARYGRGPWAIRLGVYGLEAKLDDLEKRGTGWTAIEDGPNGRRVELNRWDLDGLTIELEDLPVVHRGVGGGRM
jgi:hypothetical protein